ncbi:MAG: serine/threonine protein kinase [Deltaproteobacteria bacterium]|nr:serine/threonine protein kinase [Deltaproteobacteria bacterium]
MALADRSVDRRYRIGRRVAVRMNAEVYDAESVVDGKRRAIKRIIGKADDEEQHQRALREAAVIATLDHPNIVEVVDVGQGGSDFFLVTDFIDGPTLSEFLDALKAFNKKLQVEVACGIVGQIARGLSHAHERELPDGTALGIVHRDVSPDSIMIGLDGVPKLIDFGGATLAGHGLTRPGVVRGRAAAMSPEQAIGGSVDRRTDVYGLGALMFELLAGDSFWKGQNQAEILKKISVGAVDPIGPRIPNVDRDLVAIIEACTQRDPEARPHSARDVERRLDRFRAARQLRIDAAALAKLVEEARPFLKRKKGDGRGELENSELVLRAEAGPYDSMDGSLPASLPGVVSPSADRDSHEDDHAVAETVPAVPAEQKPKKPAPPPDKLLKRLIILCVFLLVVVSVLASMLILDR